MYLICDYKGVIAEICQRPAWVKKQPNGCVVLCGEEEADSIYSNDTDSFYPARHSAISGNPYHLEEVEEVPQGVAALTWKYQNGAYALVGSAEPLGPELQAQQSARLINTLLGA